MGCSLMKTSALDLKDEDIEFLTSNTPYTATEIKDWYKSFQKECPNGKLNQKKFIDIYKLFFHHGNPEKFCAHVFRTFDEDGSGSITFKEFLLAIGITTGKDPKAKLKWAFKMYDINNDGAIQPNEMAKIIKALYEMLGSDERDGTEDLLPDGSVDHAKKVQFIFDKIDVNKDGSVTLEEFIDACYQDQTLAKILTYGATNSP